MRPPPQAAAAERDVLLATKLHIPRPRPGLLPRPRLTERLAEGMAGDLVLVCAPAGFGKTSLLADWVRRSQRPVAWLSLDPGDNDPARFWRHAVAALDRVRPGVAEQVAGLLGPPTPPSFEGLVTALINQLAAHPDGVAGPGPVVAFGVGAERLCRLSGLMRLGLGTGRSLRHYSGHAPTLVGMRPLVNRVGAGEEGGSTVPTGVAIRDVREQLFDAAERVLLRDGPNALTSRAVTIEAGVAKGVLHRHFADFDGFLAELVLDRIARIGTQAAALGDSAGTGTVAGNLTGALMELFGSVALRIVGLVISRDGLRARLRQAGSAGVPVLREAAAMIASYLAIERDLGRIAADADVDMLAPTLIGAGHLLFADQNATPPEAGAVRKMVTTVLAGALPH